MGIEEGALYALCKLQHAVCTVYHGIFRSGENRESINFSEHILFFFQRKITFFEYLFPELFLDLAMRKFVRETLTDRNRSELTSTNLQLNGLKRRLGKYLSSTETCWVKIGLKVKS